MNQATQYSTRATRLLDRVATVVGLHPILLPAGQHNLFKQAGLPEATIEKIIKGVHSMRNWPLVWQKEAEHQAVLGHHAAAFLCYYMAQRVLINASQYKDELYCQAQAHYLLIPQRSPIERVEITYAGGLGVGYLQMPYNRSGIKPVGAVILSPGITVTKEELHYWAQPYLARNFAVLRIDNPGGYGETEGLVNEETLPIAADFVNHLHKDPRIDNDNISLIGFSLGGFFALHAARKVDVRSVITVGAPFNPSTYVPRLPPLNLLALKRIVGEWDTKKLQEKIAISDLHNYSSEINTAVLAIHGARDATVPPHEALSIAMGAGDPNGFWIFPKEAHSCLGAVDDIVGLSLSWIEDPAKFLITNPQADLQHWPWVRLMSSYPYQKALIPLATRFAQALFAPTTWTAPLSSKATPAVLPDLADEKTTA